MNYKDLVYFDIETAGNYKDLSTLQSNDIRGYELFMRKLQRKSENFADWKIDANQVYLDKSPLMPEFGRVVCVSIATIQTVDGVENLKIMSFYDDSEELLITKVQRIFTNISKKTNLGLCGFHIKGFDIPWLNRKFLKYNLPIPRVLATFNVKPWDMNVVDLAEVWRSAGTLEATSFDEMLYVLDIKSPKSVMAGKDVHSKYWIDKNINGIKTYCEADVISCVDASKKIIELI